MVHGAPLTGVVSQGNFEGKVNKDGQSKIFLRKTKVEKFEVCDSIIGLESNFTNQVDDDEGLDILVR